MMKRLAILLLIITAGCSTGVPPGPPATVHHVYLWYYAKAPADAFISHPVAGVDGLEFGSYDNDVAHVAALHAKGLKAVAAIGGDLPQTPARLAAIQNLAVQYGKRGVDFVFIDEPGGNQLTPNTMPLVAFYNPLFDLFRANNQQGKIGMCQSHGGAWHNRLLDAGLKADFACLEAYGGDTASDVAAIKAAHPNVKVMVLTYGKSETCGLWNDGQIDYFGFWDADNYGPWEPWSDGSWPADALMIPKGGC